MRISRRLLATAAAAALLLTGCATGGDAGSTTDTDGTFPQTVTTAFGDVTIDEAPERVVALGWSDAETALALGVQPVGASDWLGFGGEGVGPWAEGMYDEAPEIIETLEPSYEAIAALEPDLILDVRSSGDPDRYERLSEIAPTVGVPEGGESYLTSLDQQVTMIATALGVPEKGEELLAQVEESNAAIAEAHPEWADKTVTVGTKTSEGWGAYLAGDGRLEQLEAYGFTQNPSVAALEADASGFAASVSSEELDVFEADLIVAFPIFIDTTEITDDAQWQALQAVQDGHAIVIDGDLSQAFSANSPLSVQYTADELPTLIEEALGTE
jgi:iron complex transport system substrate-binding protein